MKIWTRLVNGRLALSLLAVVVATAGCADRLGSGPADGTSGKTELATGKLSLSVAPTGTDLAGFTFAVTDADGRAVASTFVASFGGAPPSTVFLLQPGAYVATATAMRDAQTPAAECAPATAPARVTAGQTSELVLVTRCRAADVGGLAIAARADHEPRWSAVELTPAQQVSVCAPVSLTVAAVDPDADPLRYEFEVAAPAGAAATDYAIDAQGASARLLASAAGDYAFTARACDAAGCVALSVPVHVIAATGVSCTATCDDENPCTTDSKDAAGLCTHTPVADGPLCRGGALHVKVLGWNDFHGHLAAGSKVGTRPVGGADVLAAYLEAASTGLESQTLLVHAGDQVGASPPESALLQDEPSLQFLNLLANSSCTSTNRVDPECNVVGTLGNHEFDEGRGELLRLLTGGNAATGPFLENPYQGVRFPYVSANVIDVTSNAPLLPPYVVKRVHGVPVAFIGAVLKDTPTIVTPTGVAGLKFLDEADAINSYVPELVRSGVRAIVVTIHQGGSQTSYTGPTKTDGTTVNGSDIQRILARLDDEIDVVVSGHSHSFTNALVKNAHGHDILVTQAFSYGTAYDDIDLYVDPVSHDVVAKSAQVVTTYSDAGPGLRPDPVVTTLVTAAQARVAPLVTRVVGSTDLALTQTENAAGESLLGDLIADAQREAMGTDFAFMNPGGIRAPIDAGEITWGELFAVQPFGNTLVRLNLTGAQIYDVLEQQWAGQPFPRIMKTSGLQYTWDPARPVGSRVLEVRRAGQPIDRTATYSVTCNNFMATGGDNFKVFTAGTDQVGGPVDLDALVDYVEHHSPLHVQLDGRISLAPKP